MRIAKKTVKFIFFCLLRNFYDFLLSNFIVDYMVERRSESELIKDFKNGNEDVFNLLVERYAAKLLIVANGIVSSRQDAEEIVQDAFVRAYKGLKEFRGAASFETWIHRIVVNLAHNKFQWNRRRGSEQNVSITVDDDNSDNGTEIALPDNTHRPEKIMLKEEFAGEIKDCFEKLPDKLREVMVMRLLEELSYDKIASIIDCKVGTVKSRIARGREMMRTLLGSCRDG